MPKPREAILEWTATGRLKTEDVPRAFEVASLTPSLSDWRRFLQTLLLWTGVVLVAAGVIFFFAFNWRTMNRFGKFAIAETLLTAAFIAGSYLGIERPAGQAAVTGAALLTGALLALVGQIYQTGADAFELFAAWALLIVPWVIVARFAPLWLLWISLLNVSVTLFFLTFRWGFLGILFGESGSMWALFALNTVALAVWEAGALYGIQWLSRWGARVLAVFAGSSATSIGVLSVLDTREMPGWAFFAFAAWIVAMYLVYRRQIFDVFMLAGAALATIVVVVTFLARHLLDHGGAGEFLLVGLATIGLSSAAAMWIRRLSQEQLA
jgi:uncharacterized membrane protein